MDVINVANFCCLLIDNHKINFSKKKIKKYVGRNLHEVGTHFSKFRAVGTEAEKKVMAAKWASLFIFYPLNPLFPTSLKMRQMGVIHGLYTSAFFSSKYAMRLTEEALLLGPEFLPSVCVAKLSGEFSNAFSFYWFVYKQDKFFKSQNRRYFTLFPGFFLFFLMSW